MDPKQQELSDRFRLIGSIIVVPIIVVVFVISFLMERAGDAAVSKLVSLPASQIESIEIRTDPADIHIRTVTDPQQISSFLDCLIDLEDYSPNHPNYSRSFFFRLHLQVDRTVDFELHLLDPPDGYAYVYIVRRFSNRKFTVSSFHGTRKSTCLYNWMTESNIIGDWTIPSAHVVR